MKKNCGSCKYFELYDPPIIDSENSPLGFCCATIPVWVSTDDQDNDRYFDSRGERCDCYTRKRK